MENLNQNNENIKQNEEKVEQTKETEIEKKIEKVIEKTLLSRYIECPKCLDLIRKGNAVCKRCGLKYENGKWVEIKEEEEKWLNW